MKLLIVAALALMLTPVASARLRMGGNVTAQNWAWAVDASHNVPLPDAGFVIRSGSGSFDGHTMTLPKVGQGRWTEISVHGAFLHELGHAYDFSNMTATRRVAFRRAMGVPSKCKWWTPCLQTSNMWKGWDGVPPGEIFADEYAACALNLTQREYIAAGYASYGWLPSEGSDEIFCGLIRVKT